MYTSRRAFVLLITIVLYPEPSGYYTHHMTFGDEDKSSTRISTSSEKHIFIIL